MGLQLTSVSAPQIFCEPHQECMMQVWRMIKKSGFCVESSLVTQSADPRDPSGAEEGTKINKFAFHFQNENCCNQVKWCLEY